MNIRVIGAMNLFSKIKIVAFLLLVANFAFAGVVDVTKTSILAQNTNANDTLLLKQAFAQIIVNNTGEPIDNVLQNSQFNEIDIKAGIKRSYFEKVDDKFLTNKDQDYFWFNVVMYKNFIEKFIKDAGFSLLPHNRQEILVWAAIEETVINEEPKILADDEIAIPPINEQAMTQDPKVQYAYGDEIFMYWFKKWAQSMGMVFIMPTIDENDMLAVKPEYIQNLTHHAHEQTKLEYGKNLSLVVFLKRDEYGVKYRTGTFIDDNEMSIKHFQESNVQEGELIYSVVAEMAEKYADNFKVNSIDLSSHTVQLVINAINGFDDINKIKQYVSDLSVIEKSYIVSASQGQLVITANLLVSTDSFLQIVKRQNVLFHNQNGSINQLVFNLKSEF